MIFDAENQNKNLKDAGQKNIDTSPRVKEAISESKKVTTGKEESTRSVDTGKRKISQSKDRKIGGKPSYEGYMHSPSASISINNTGYLNKDFQTSRNSENKLNQFLGNKDKMLSRNQPYLGLSQTMPKGMSVTNYSKFTENNSSSSRMSAIIRNNNII